MSLAMAKGIRQTVTFDAKPAVIYRALLDSKQHSAFTKAPAKIDPRVGGSVSAHGGWISGVNVELVKGVRIVQAWRGKNWPAGSWSVAVFALSPAGTGQSKLTFCQDGVPDEHAKMIESGWHKNYWTPLKAWLKKGSQPKKASAKKRK
jgi:activator of HSP90 ATPase